MVLPTKDQPVEDSSASDDLDKKIPSEDTSTSKTPEKETSTFDVIMDAIKPKGEDEGEHDAKSEQDDPEKSEDKKSKDEKSEDKTGESDDPTEEELKAWKPKTKKRFENLQAKYRDVNQRLEKAEAEAGHYRQFVDFLDTNGLSQEEANQLFNIGAMMKNDPFAALEALAPYYNQLLEITGQVLPPDLAQQVKAGYLTENHALEISKSRAMGRIVPVINQDKQQRQQKQEVRQQSQNTAAMQNAVALWEQNWSSSDPDYSIKKDRVLDRLELMLARAARSNTLPNTVEQAVALAEKAKRDIDIELRQSRPRKAVSTVDGNSTGTSHQPEPKDTRELIRRTLNV